MLLETLNNRLMSYNWSIIICKSTHLYGELLHLCDRLVDGVVVALVGDVVPASRPCWLHITREEGLFPGSPTLVLLKSRTHSFVGLCLSHARNSP